MQVLKISKNNFKEIINKIANSIQNKEILVLPTDTVYGLVGDVSDKKVVEKIFKIKKRSLRKPIPIFIKDIEMAKKLAKINKNQEKFLKHIWPGAVTAVLKRKMTKNKIYGVDKKTIALRIPNYKLINKLLTVINLPLSGTSANISEEPASTKIKEVLEQFKNQKYQPDLVIDAGNLPLHRPSLILDLTVQPPKILRV